jgi:hypothetical protein
MIGNWVHKVHIQNTITHGDKLKKFTGKYTHVHPTIKRLLLGTHGFTFYKTFSIYFSYREFTGKYTHVHPKYRTTDSDAITPCHVLAIIDIIAIIFFYALSITTGVVA